MGDEPEIIDGYVVVPKVSRDPLVSPVIKGIQCGECFMKFDYNKAYGYACQNARCPMTYGVSP